jgi:hypothetical protein
MGAMAAPEKETSGPGDAAAEVEETEEGVVAMDGA